MSFGRCEPGERGEACAQACIQVGRDGEERDGDGSLAIGDLKPTSNTTGRTGSATQARSFRTLLDADTIRLLTDVLHTLLCMALHSNPFSHDS